ncbi:MAG: hypothetical protein WDN75_06055 [Bacteroidota bacterium]
MDEKGPAAFYEVADSFPANVNVMRHCGYDQRVMDKRKNPEFQCAERLPRDGHNLFAHVLPGVTSGKFRPLDLWSDVHSSTMKT